MKNLLIQGREEIIRLRRENEILQAKVGVFETLSNFLYAKVPGGNYGEVVDVAWQMQKQIDELSRIEAADNR